MHIGVDLDNTVVDSTTAYLRIYNRVSGQTKTPADIDDFQLWRLYGWTLAQYQEIYARHGHEIHEKSTPMPGALPVLQAWYDHHQISIITARPATFHAVTRAWLRRFEVPHHALAFSEDKYSYCVSNGIDVLVDDGPHYAEEFARQRRPLVLLDQPYNRGSARPFVHRASDWQEIAYHIRALDGVPM